MDPRDPCLTHVAVPEHAYQIKRGEPARMYYANKFN